MVPSGACHGKYPIPVQTMAMLSLLMPEIEYGFIFLKFSKRSLLAVMEQLAPPSMWSWYVVCTMTAQFALVVPNVVVSERQNDCIFWLRVTVSRGFII